jgi:hypothetical protein
VRPTSAPLPGPRGISLFQILVTLVLRRFAVRILRIQILALQNLGRSAVPIARIQILCRSCRASPSVMQSAGRRFDFR